MFRAAAVRDAAGVDARPGAVAVCGGRIAAAGAADAVAGRFPAAELVELPRALLLPAMVNAHAHLDLTAIGPRPYGGDFTGWVRGVMAARPRSADAVRAAVAAGVSASVAAGVGLIGDIAGDPVAVDAWAGRAAEMPGVSYLEVVGLGAAAAAAAAAARADLDLLRSRHPTARIELQPHAPYSAGAELYDLAAAGAPSTHLAETRAELEFVRSASGPFADLLRGLGKWDDRIRGAGLTPVAWLEPSLRRASWLLAHCNYLDDADVALLAETGASVAYCPVASDYFGHRGHRYRELLDAGVNVCLGTDSILCQPPEEEQPLGILPQARHLFRRDGADPGTLLAMATVRGHRALGLPPELEPALRPGARAAIVAVEVDPDDPADPWVQALADDGPARRIGRRG